MFEDLSEKYTDVLSLQTPPFISIWQKASASMDSSGKQIEEQGQHPTWAQGTILMAWHGNDATFRSWEYCTSSITKKAPWISPFFSSKYEEASWSWCFWVIWVERKKKVNVCLKKAASVCLSRRQCRADGQGWERLCSQAPYPGWAALLHLLLFLSLHYCHHQHSKITGTVSIQRRNSCSPSTRQILAVLLSKNPRPTISYTPNMIN